MNKYISLLMILLLVCLVSCTKGNKSSVPVPAPSKTITAPKKNKVKPVIVQEEEKKPAYMISGTRDPFLPFEIALSAEMDTGKTKKITDPLQKLTLSQIELTGIILGQENRALIQDSSGMGYILKEGTLVGENSGIVTEILLSGVKIKQHFKDYMGRVNTREVVLSLRKEEGE